VPESALHRLERQLQAAVGFAVDALDDRFHERQ
jgi:hypothetical protein